MAENEKRVGITTAVPVEIVYAAGLVPVDLNNAFISSPNPMELVEEAEGAGFPRNICAWIKGIYSACRRAGLKRLIGVVRGDCSNTQALMEILHSEGVETIEFAYPTRRLPGRVRAALEEFAADLGTDLKAAEEWRQRLAPVRAMLAELDELACQDGRVRPEEAHLWMVSSSDFRGDPEAFERELAGFLAEARDRPAPSPSVPVALAGVPPIASDFFPALEALGVRVVYNEIPYEFTMARPREKPLEEIYAEYTYPYDVFHRLSRLEEEVARRGARGLVHYVQSFCYRQIQDRLLRERLPVPVLALECDRPGPLDAGARTRLEGFVEMLRSREGVR